MDILQGLINFLASLDWVYIGSFILISYFLASDTVLTTMKPTRLKLVLLAIPRVWRVLAIGIIWGVAVFWIRDYYKLENNGKDKLEWLISSLFFAMVAYQAIVKRIQSLLGSPTDTPPNS
jgi:hypothetical protein